MRGHFGSRWEQQVRLLRIFLKQTGLPSQDVEMDTTETGSQHKEKGGIRLKGTTEHFAMKYQEAANAESMVRLALATDGDVDMVVDAETLARKTFMDSMEPEAHANTILATDFDHPPSGRWPFRTKAHGRTSTSTRRPARRRRRSGHGSSRQRRRRTRPLADPEPPASKGETSTRSRSSTAPDQQAYQGGAGLGRGVPPQSFQPAKSQHTPTKSVEIQRMGKTDTYKALPARQFPTLG